MVAQRAEDGSEEVGGDVRHGRSKRHFDAHLIAVGDVITGDVWNVKEIFAGRDAAPLAEIVSVGDGIGDATNTERDVESSGSSGTLKLGNIDFRKELEGSEIKNVGMAPRNPAYLVGIFAGVVNGWEVAHERILQTMQGKLGETRFESAMKWEEAGAILTRFRWSKVRRLLYLPYRRTYR